MPTPDTPTGPATILLVEDERLVRWSLARALQDAGYSVTVADDGPGAVALLRSRPFDLVITDYHLPGLDGLRVAENVKPATPILLISADPDTPVWKTCPGVCAFVPKPFDLSDMTTLVRSLLAKGG